MAYIRLSLRRTAQPRYTRFPIIFGGCFSKVAIGFIPTARAGCAPPGSRAARCASETSRRRRRLRSRSRSPRAALPFFTAVLHCRSSLPLTVTGCHLIRDLQSNLAAIAFIFRQNDGCRPGLGLGRRAARPQRRDLRGRLRGHRGAAGAGRIVAPCHLRAVARSPLHAIVSNGVGTSSSGAAMRPNPRSSWPARRWWGWSCVRPTRRRAAASPGRVCHFKSDYIHMNVLNNSYDRMCLRARSVGICT